MSKDLIQVINSQDFSKSHELWLRISAFLQLKSKNTQITYLGIIKEYCEFLGAVPGTKIAATKIIKASDIHAVAYKTWLESRPGNKPRIKRSQKALSKAVSKRRVQNIKKDGTQSTLSNATIRKKFAALRRIYRMLIASDLGIKNNPFDVDRVPVPPSNSGQKRPTEMLDFDKVFELINSIDGDSKINVRDKAILSLLFGGGLRRNEVTNILIADVRKTGSGTSFIYLRSTKAKRDAEQALPDWASLNLLNLVAQRKKEGAEDGDYVFVRYTGKGFNTPGDAALSDNGLYRIFKGHCLRLGLGDFLTPHSARATSITKLLHDGIPHREVQEFSRHSSVQMVEVYDKRRFGVDKSPAKKLKY